MGTGSGRYFRTAEWRERVGVWTKAAWKNGKHRRTPEHNAKIRLALLRANEHTLRERVLSKVDRTGGAHSCWVFVGRTDSKGYGKVKVGGRSVGAHRVVYELLIRKLEEYELLLHNCEPFPDNPACCNPAHLRPGTLQENVRDAVKKRQLRQGANHPNAKLTAAQVVEIRENTMGLAYRERAAKYGVSQGHLYRILCGISWAAPQVGEQP